MLKGGGEGTSADLRQEFALPVYVIDLLNFQVSLSLSLSLSWHSIASDLPVADGPPDSRVGWRKGRVAGGLCWVR